MKAVSFVLIILGVIFAYSFISEYANNGNFSGTFNSVEEPTNNTAGPKNYYTSSTTKTNEPTPTPATTPNSTISPYIEKVQFSGIQSATSYRPAIVILKVIPYRGEQIKLTGFTVKNRRGTFTITDGIEKYQVNGSTSTIYINEPLYVYLIGITNPLGTDKNFRVNKCFGYLSRAENLYPSFGPPCVTPKLENLSGYTPYCQEYLIHSSGCKMPNYSSNFKISTDSNCVSYILEYWSYDGCLRRSAKDNDFYGSRWYIYTNKNFVEPLHDTISLYDPSGLLVDQYTY